MRGLYNLSIRFFALGIHLASLFTDKAKKFHNGRKNIFKRIESELQSNSSKIIWMHCASVGEFEQGRPVLEQIRQEMPEFKIFLTFFSPSGYEAKKDNDVADWTFYLPLDSPNNANRFIDLVKPAMVVFVKYEVWPNYFFGLQKRNIPLILISAIFRDGQRFFKNNWWEKVLKSCAYFFVQDQHSKKLLNSIGISDVEVVGDTRFDRVRQISLGLERNLIVENFKDGQLLFVSGSSWPTDEQLLQNYITQSKTKFKVIIAPHEVNIKRIQEVREMLGNDVLLYSEATVKNAANYSVLIIDNIGLLSRIYAYADIVQIGGGFGAGIHNILEAATYGMPIVFGPKFQKFKEAKDLIDRKSAFSVTDQNEFNLLLDNFINSIPEREKCKQICKTYIVENLGATEKIVRYLNKY